MIYQNGNHYSGEWKYGKESGLGRYYSNGRLVSEGEWNFG